MEENERAQDMRTGQDKKEFMPNFLKDLNTEILEQLTKGSSEKNVVGLAGDVKELKAVEAVCGLRFKGYLGLVEVERPSGITDTLVVAFAWDTPYKSTQGVQISCTGCVRAGKMQQASWERLKSWKTQRKRAKRGIQSTTGTAKRYIRKRAKASRILGTYKKKKSGTFSRKKG